MEYTTLGDSGLSVSRIGVGCGRFGRDDPTKADGSTSQAIVDRAIELGVNLFDTANSYGDGESEQLLGDALETHDRDFPVIATKVFAPRYEGPNAAGLSRKSIERELEGSLDRLGIETIDLYQIHRWDRRTPIEETLRTLGDAVRRNEVRYLGASSMWAYQFLTALHTSDRLGMERFISMQNHYNLVYREEEREMLPLCEREGIGVLPWSPLACGFLTRPAAELDATPRGKALEKSDQSTIYRSDGGKQTNERLEQLAADYGVTMAQLALAWLLHQECVDAPIVGMRTVDHLEQAVAAVDISLSSSDQEHLEEAYSPKEIWGHQ